MELAIVLIFFIIASLVTAAVLLVRRLTRSATDSDTMIDGYQQVLEDVRETNRRYRNDSTQ